MKVRCEIDRFESGERRTTVRYFDPDDVSPAAKALAAPLVDQAIDRLTAETHLDREDAAMLLLAMAIELEADAEAYEREAARRGVLAL